MTSGTGLAILAVDAALVVIVVELLVIAMRLRAAPRLGRRAAVASALAGLFLLLALRLALADAAAGLIVMALAGGGLAHAADLWLRSQQSRRPEG